MNGKRLLTVLMLGAGLGLATTPALHAESNFAIGAGSNATARLDFRIIIPRYLLFRVGTPGTNNVDLVAFDYGGGLPTQLGNGTPLPATGGTGVVTVSLTTNATGAVTIGSSTPVGGLTNGGSGVISFGEITTVGTGILTPPVLVDGVTAGVGQTPGAGTLTDTWTYSYDNNTVPEEGTYGGAGVGTVTYTATLP